MSRNANGTYSLPGGVNPVVADTYITALWANSTLADMASEITNSLDRNGRGSMLAPLKLYAGSLALPGMTWALETNSGWYRVGSQTFAHVVNGVEVFRQTGALSTFTTPAALPSASTVNSNVIGYRDVVRRTSAFARGECTAISAGITLNTSDMAAGYSFSVYNDSAASITITQGAGVTLRLAGTTTTGNRTLAARGMATIWCNSGTEAIVIGAGVT